MNLCTCTRAESDKTTDVSIGTQPERNGLVPIDESPFIGETPQVSLQTWLTPNPNFYVRNHFSTPTEIPGSWNLVVDGHVDKTLDLSLEDFRCLPKQTLPITMECAGNNRSDLQPKVPGNPFQSGAVSTAIWGGVPLSCVLERAGI
ncbi:MAG: molybdopterin-dependent oxidoreductase, partial [Dehalococcoidia bacterium]